MFLNIKIVLISVLIQCSTTFEHFPATLTDDEKNILAALRDSWKFFEKLQPKMRKDFVKDFLDSIHNCQKIIALRVAERANPEIWNIFNRENSESSDEFS